MASQTKKRGGDRRSRRTSMALQQGLVELLLEKPLREISISEITEAADVSRTTFYLHYRNIKDLFLSMENAIYRQFKQIIHQSMADEHNLLWVEFDGEGKARMPALEEVFRFIYDNRDLSMVLLNNPDSTFLDRIWMEGHDVLIQRISSLQPDLKINLIEYTYIQVISGIQGMIEHWIATDMKEPVARMAEMATSFTVRNIGRLLEDETDIRRLSPQANK